MQGLEGQRAPVISSVYTYAQVVRAQYRASTCTVYTCIGCTHAVCTYRHTPVCTLTYTYPQTFQNHDRTWPLLWLLSPAQRTRKPHCRKLPDAMWSVFSLYRLGNRAPDRMSHFLLPQSVPCRCLFPLWQMAGAHHGLSLRRDALHLPCSRDNCPSRS